MPIYHRKKLKFIHFMTNPYNLMSNFITQINYKNIAAKLSESKIGKYNKKSISFPLRNIDLLNTLEESASFPDMETDGNTPIVFIDLVTENAMPTEESKPIEKPKPVEDSKPVEVVNIWKIRQEAEQALAKAMKAQKKTEKPQTIQKPVQKPITNPDDDGFREVLPKKKYVKSKPRQEDNDNKEVVKAVDSTGKNILVQKNSIGKPHITQPKPDTNTSKSKDRYLKAFNVAQDIMIQECIEIIPRSDFNKINTESEYVRDFKRIYFLDFTNDLLISETDGLKYNWSRSHFFQNIAFQAKLRNRLSEMFPFVWVLFFKGKKEGTQVIQLTQRKDFK